MLVVLPNLEIVYELPDCGSVHVLKLSVPTQFAWAAPASTKAIDAEIIIALTEYFIFLSL